MNKVMWIRSIQHHKRYPNKPVNMDNIIYFYTSDNLQSNGTDADRNYYSIEFMAIRESVSWRFEDELTRDNRYLEILQYIEAKEF